MATQEQTEQLNALVAQAGSVRKASLLIETLHGVAPSKSAIDRAIKGSGTDYVVHCMIRDLRDALNIAD